MPYDEYLINGSDEPSFASQIYDIVIVRRLRPTLIRQLKDKEQALVCISLFLKLEGFDIFSVDNQYTMFTY